MRCICKFIATWMIKLQSFYVLEKKQNVSVSTSKVDLRPFFAKTKSFFVQKRTKILHVRIGSNVETQEIIIMCLSGNFKVTVMLLYFTFILFFFIKVN